MFSFIEPITNERNSLLALDLQDCAVSTAGAEKFLAVAKMNSLIHIIDIRNNVLVDRAVMEKLIEQLLINCEDDRNCEVCLSLSLSLEDFLCLCSTNG